MVAHMLSAHRKVSAPHHLRGGYNNRCVHRVIYRANANTAVTKTEPLNVWLAGDEAARDIKLQIMPEGKGQAVVVIDVQPGSPAAEAGVLKGQKLIGISDPLRDTQIWEMGTRPSLRFVREMLKIRRSSPAQLVFTDFLNASDPAWAQLGNEGGSSMGPSGSVQGSNGSNGAISGEEGSLADWRRDSMISESEDEIGMTVGERMAAQFAAKQRAASQATEVTKRIAKRKAYLEEVDKRNDTPLVVGLLAAFLGPAVIILGVAASSGYLDHLYDVSITLR